MAAVGTRDDDPTISGETTRSGFAGAAFGITRADRRRPMLIEGMTGTGKTTPSKNTIVQWAERNRRAWRAGWNGPVRRPRRRVGRRELSALLLRPLWRRCPTPGSGSRLAAGSLASLPVTSALLAW